jgi:glutamate racemase
VLISSADETAFTVRALVDEHGLGAPPGAEARHTFVTSGDTRTFRDLGVRFLGPEVETVEAWSWS